MATAGSAVTQRAGSLSRDQWKGFFDSDGRLVNEINMRKAVFEGTISHAGYAPSSVHTLLVQELL